MNKRLKVIVILLGAVYCFTVISTVINEGDSFMAGYREGYEGHEGNKSIRTIVVYMKPKAGEYTFPDALLNRHTGKTVSMELEKVKLRADIKNTAWWGTVLLTLNFTIVFIVMVLLLVIPFLLFKILFSVIKDEVFDHKNIKRFQWIGYIVLMFLTSQLLGTLNDYWTIKNQAGFETYDVVYKFNGYSYLFLGFGTLLFAEILKISTQIKKENELTI